MRAGALRHRVAIQSKREERDQNGGVAEIWVTDFLRWAQISPLRGRELLEAQQVDARLTHKITLRFCPGLTPSQRLRFRGRSFNFTIPFNPDERNIAITVWAMEDI